MAGQGVRAFEGAKVREGARGAEAAYASAVVGGKAKAASDNSACIFELSIRGTIGPFVTRVVGWKSVSQRMTRSKIQDGSAGPARGVGASGSESESLAFLGSCALLPGLATL